MEKLLKDLEDLGVYIPKNLDDAQLLRYLKQLNPWTVTVLQKEDGSWIAKTSENPASLVHCDHPAKAAALLLVEQLKAGRYPVSAVGYKLTASQRNQ
jgi:hypothetical protein